MNRRILLLFLAALFTFVPSIALAGYVCGTLTYFDQREHRDNLGKLKDSTDNTNRPMRWVEVTIREENGYCQDGYGGCTEGPNNGEDAVWETVVSSSNGTFCTSTTLPSWADVYYTAEYVNYISEVRDSFDNLPRVFSTTNYNIGTTNITKDWSMTCTGNSTCEAIYTPYYIPASSIVNASYPAESAYSNILATMADIDANTSNSTLQSNGHTNKFTVYYPESPIESIIFDSTCATNSQCPAGYECSNSDCVQRKCSTFTGMRQWGYDSTCVVNGASKLNHHLTHEIGHLVHKRRVNVSGSITGCGSHSWTTQNDCDPNGNSLCVLGNKCATAEGWADFFAASIYFYPSTATPWVRVDTRNLEGDTSQGNGGSTLECVSENNSPLENRGNAARLFWDLHDSTTSTDDGFDNARIYLSDMVAIWDDFPISVAEGCSTSACDQNREGKESGSTGRNLWDYRFYAYSTNDIGWEMYHNCVNGQDTL